MNSRVSKLASDLSESQSILVTKPANVRYLCGYSGSNGILLIASNGATLFTDSRYAISASHETFDVDLNISGDLFDSASKQVSTSELLIEANDLRVATFNRLKSLLVNCELVETSGVVEALRVIKDDVELNLIATACEISTTALARLTTSSLIGMTELEISRKLESEMLSLGADAIAFETIVASGPNSAIAHHQPTGRKLESGEFLKIDFGAKVSGYHSDCTRTFIAGVPATWQTELYEQVLLAQSASRGVLRHGVSLPEVVAPTISQFEASGYLNKFGHGLGHGVGLEIHEDPFLSAKSPATLSRGTVITVEPGLYLENQGGVRIEDTVVVTESGYENLTKFSYELQQIS